MKSSNIGGQAVLEGIMMRHGDDYAVAVRKPDGEIFVQKEEYHKCDQMESFNEDSVYQRGVQFYRFYGSGN